MGKLNLELVNQKLENENNSGNVSSEFVYDKLVDGKNIRRILFPKGDKDMFFVDGYFHYRTGTEQKTYVCPTSHGNNCPICAALYKLKDSKNPEDVETYNTCRRKRRIAINVLDRNEPNPQPKILMVGATILKGILQTISDPDYGDITDAVTGRDVTITRSGKGLNTSYSVIAKPQTSPVENAEEIDKAMANLDDLFTCRPLAELEGVATQIVPAGTQMKAPSSNVFQPKIETDVDTNAALQILGKITA